MLFSKEQPRWTFVVPRNNFIGLEDKPYLVKQIDVHGYSTMYHLDGFETPFNERDLKVVERLSPIKPPAIGERLLGIDQNGQSIRTSTVRAMQAFLDDKDGEVYFLIRTTNSIYSGYYKPWVPLRKEAEFSASFLFYIDF